MNTLTDTYGWAVGGTMMQSPGLTNNTVAVTEGDINTVITTAQLSYTDGDTDDTTLSYTVGNVSHGTLTINGAAWASGTNDTFTQQDIIDGKIFYSHDDSNTSSDSFSFTVTDGIYTIANSFAITVIDVAAQADNATVVTGTPTVVNPLANDTDNTFTALTNVGDTVTLASGTTVTLRAVGRLDVVAGANGSETFRYQASDGVSTSTGTVNLTANNVSNFNQDITKWDTSSLEYMQLTFVGANAFNQNLGDWNISNVKGMSSAFSSSGLSIENYDAILTGWATENVQSNVFLGASGL